MVVDEVVKFAEVFLLYKKIRNATIDKIFRIPEKFCGGENNYYLKIGSLMTLHHLNS